MNEKKGLLKLNYNHFAFKPTKNKVNKPTKTSVIVSIDQSNIHNTKTNCQFKMVKVRAFLLIFVQENFKMRKIGQKSIFWRKRRNTKLPTYYQKTCYF